MSTAVDYSPDYDPESDFDHHYTRATAERIAEVIAPADRVLELGCATGAMGAQLVAVGAHVVGVDRSSAYLRRADARGLRDARYLRADLDVDAWDGEVGGPFDHVLVCNLLHEVADPVVLLERAGALLAPGGRLHLTLQNPHSIHRLVALEMGIIADLRDVSERGRRYGTRGLWDADELIAMAGRAGLSVRERGGVMLKPLPNRAMADLPGDVLDGFTRAARHLPGNCAMTYLVLGR